MTNSTFFLFTGIGSLLYSFYAGARYYSLTGLNLVTPTKAKKLIKTGEIKNIIDVRTNMEYKMGHYPRAKNIPVTEFSKNKFRKFDMNQGILLYCNTGQRSRRAAELLTGYGFKKVYYIDGLYTSLK
jgi:rhodanese-related sulfurtransferase